jgi:hypothetical protein
MMQRSKSLKSRAEAFCAKLNDGLVAVAIVLAMLVSVVGSYRTIELLEAAAQDGYAMRVPADIRPQSAAF